MGRCISILPVISHDRRVEARRSLRRGLRVSPGFAALLALSAFLSPPELTGAVLLAAAFHECAHLAALALFGVPTEGVSLSAAGAVIHARGAARLSYGRELAVTLAGPGANLLLAPLVACAAAHSAWPWGWLFAGANTLLGVYNLLPIPPLDGARALYLFTAWRFGPAAGDAVSGATGLLCAAALAALSVRLTAEYGGALLPLAAFALLFRAIGQLGLAHRAANV